VAGPASEAEPEEDLEEDDDMLDFKLESDELGVMVGREETGETGEERS
jgi:hypothetical protein